MPEAAVIEEIQEKLIPKIVKLENQQDLKAKIGFRMREWKEKDFNAMALANFICGALGEYYCDTGEFVEK